MDVLLAWTDLPDLLPICTTSAFKMGHDDVHLNTLYAKGLFMHLILSSISN